MFEREKERLFPYRGHVLDRMEELCLGHLAAAGASARRHARSECLPPNSPCDSACPVRGDRAASVHVLPTWGVPSPDVVTYYRYWAASPDNAALMRAIPEMIYSFTFLFPPSYIFIFYFWYCFFLNIIIFKIHNFL